MIDLHYFIEASALLLFFSLYYRFFLRQELWFDWNRAYLLFSVLAVLLLPCLNGNIGQANLLEYPIMEELVISSQIAENQLLEWTPTQLVKGFYFMGLGVSLIMFLLRLITLVPWVLQAKKTASQDHYIVHTQGKLPTSSFLWVLFWDDSQKLNEAQKRQMLAHELCHIRQLHSLDLLLMEILQLVLWFHPVVYWMRREMLRTHEFLADREACKTDGKAAYSRLLLTRALRTSELTLLHSFYNSQTLLRMKMLQKISSKPFARLRYLMLAPFVLGLFSASLLAGNQLEILKTEAPIIHQIQGDEQPKPLNLMEIYQKLVYPENAKKRNLEATVIVKLVINKQGEVAKHEFVGEAPGVFRDAVRPHLTGLKFEPATQNGKPVNAIVTLPFAFRLGEK